ncbi:MAG TPA: crotonase/enoyl-CoA hydratase family protein [Trebonia sp.]|nr:crotonase/enoyl-CoA hydratase family protein [Trebonia sp.]
MVNVEPRSEHVPESVIVEQIDGVQVITINRPEARNAINAAVTGAVAAAVDELDQRADLTLGIITGAGGSFCAGMDLKAFLAGEDMTLPGRGLAGIVQRPPRKPMIAAVEGWALAGGFEIALTCDLIVAAEDAQFGLPEVKRGLVAAAGGLLRLPQRIPPAIAMRLALTGEPLSAAEASRLGLVNELTAPGGALAGALDLARRITANGPLAVQITKQIMVQAAEESVAAGFERQQPLVAQIMTSADAREGAAAFAEKRRPAWTGR